MYSYSGGTLTLVASTAVDGNIWKGAANTVQTVAFTTPYNAAAGVYFIGFVYSQSAQTTAPTLGSAAVVSNGAVQSAEFTNSAKLYAFVFGTSLPSSQAMSGVTASTGRQWFAVY